MKFRGRRDRTVAQRRGTEIDPKRDRVTADAHLLPGDIDLVRPLRLRPVNDTGLDALRDEKPKSSIAAPDQQQRGKDRQAETRRARHALFLDRLSLIGEGEVIKGFA